MACTAGRRRHVQNSAPPHIGTTQDVRPVRSAKDARVAPVPGSSALAFHQFGPRLAICKPVESTATRSHLLTMTTSLARSQTPEDHRRRNRSEVTAAKQRLSEHSPPSKSIPPSRHAATILALALSTSSAARRRFANPVGDDGDPGHDPSRMVRGWDGPPPLVADDQAQGRRALLCGHANQCVSGAPDRAFFAAHFSAATGVIWPLQYVAPRHRQGRARHDAGSRRDFTHTVDALAAACGASRSMEACTSRAPWRPGEELCKGIGTAGFERLRPHRRRVVELKLHSPFPHPL